MVRHIAFCCILFFISQQAFARQDSLDLASSARHGHVRVSLITCGMGYEEWQTFGHTTLRVIDSEKTGIHRDIVYNYGTFDGFDGNFELQFLTGTMTYFLDVVYFNNFIREYEQTGRGVIEQEILLTPGQKEHLISRLEENALLKNRSYRYDVFYNNCCTKVRDLIEETFGPGFAFGPAFPPNMQVSLRTAYCEYYKGRPWERTGLNIVIGSPADTIISNHSIMFIPDFLSKCAAEATFNGKKVFGNKITILEDHVNQPAVVDAPFLLTCFIALLTIAGLSLPRLRILGSVMSVLVPVISGVFGCLILFFWFFSNHACAKYNFNILWALPTNMLLPFIKFKWKRHYALAGMCLIFIPLLMSILKVQVIPLYELGPFLLALLCVYGNIYRRSKANVYPAINK